LLIRIQITVPNCQKYTPTDLLFRRFCPLGFYVEDVLYVRKNS